MKMHAIGITTEAVILLALFAATVAHLGLYLPALFAIGLLLGMVLYLSRFGFASAYRKLFTQGDVEGLRAQIMMLILATSLFAPALATGSIAGNTIVGAVAPLGWPVAAGACMFGIGMQLGGGCGSGTLYTLGGGSLRMAITLAAFIAGAFWASLHMNWWQALPAADAWVLGERLGWWQAAGLQVTLLGALYVLLTRYGRRAVQPMPSRHFFGTWSLMQGALALAILNFATLSISGHPWTITWAFTLWGAKMAMLVGWSPEHYAFWQSGFPQAALGNSLLHDETSLMDIGIILGALLAGLISRRASFTWQASPGAILASLLGGLAMGYGARIAYGCNIGAFFSGVASTSLHGWLWIAAALVGTWVGVRLRPGFGLPN